ncbi:DUF4870 domain-containing protein [Natronorubrum halophilum]|uniref:DUF4870 domain-containing protein n=1 Tax=Natronorubrum halophilum TaxID=1702106 RepID=UPI000EF707B9|nr:DUF4870 domain-containing protein [Natronorubrum halophilum]
MSTNTSPTDSPSNEPSPSEQSSTPPGPALLAERSLLGIFVHFFAIVPLWGVLVAGLVYRFSSHEFTRANARNAFNWQLLVTGSIAATLLGVFGLSALVDRVALPGLIETLVFLPVLAVMILMFALTWLNFIFPFVAMGKAIFGGAWNYLFVPDFLRLVATRTRFGQKYSNN